MSAPLLLLDPASPLPAYEQIRSQLRALVAMGRLAPGARLPSVRQLARDLGIAPNTVVRAYDELEAEGWVTGSPRRGISVVERVMPMDEEERRGQVRQAVQRLLVSVQHLGVSVADLHAEIDRQCVVTVGPEHL